MALIYCTNCGKQISDEAKRCPQCGIAVQKSTVTETVTAKCPECGKEYGRILVSCPECGRPNDKMLAEIGIKKKKKALVTVIAIASALVVLLFVFCAYQKNQADKFRAEADKYRTEAESFKAEAEKSKAELEKYIADAEKKETDLATFYDNMVSAYDLILEGAVDAESVCNLTTAVWSNAIYQRQDDITDQFTMEDGKFVDDFNVALDKLFANEAYQSSIALINENRESVVSYMREMKEVPEEYAEAYNALKTLFDDYWELTSLALNPVGSYTSVSEKIISADDKLSTDIGKMMLYFDND